MAKNLKCPRCGKNTAECYPNGEVGGPGDYVDEYTLLYKDCGSILMATDFFALNLLSSHVNLYSAAFLEPTCI